MRLLDLFCGAGGAAMGYHRAGFTEIVGVDLKPQPRYPFRFIQADAMRPPLRMEDFDAIHASPPCQKWTSMQNMRNAKLHQDFIVPIRRLLKASGVPYVIENVQNAPLTRGCVRLCGSNFNLGVMVGQEWFPLRRHRFFESSVLLLGMNCRHPKRPPIGLYGDHAAKSRRHGKGQDFTIGNTIGLFGATAHGRQKGRNFSHTVKLELGRRAMDMPWCEDWKEITEAIPPAYTHFIGAQLLNAIRQERVA